MHILTYFWTFSNIKYASYAHCCCCCYCYCCCCCCSYYCSGCLYLSIYASICKCKCIWVDLSAFMWLSLYVLMCVCVCVWLSVEYETFHLKSTALMLCILCKMYSNAWPDHCRTLNCPHKSRSILDLDLDLLLCSSVILPVSLCFWSFGNFTVNLSFDLPLSLFFIILFIPF